MKSKSQKIICHFGENLKYIRRSKGISQKAAAAQLGVSFQQLQKYENGINRLPLEHLHTLKNYFGTTYENFFSTLPDAEIYKVRESSKKIERIIMMLEQTNDNVALDQIFDIIKIITKK